MNILGKIYITYILITQYIHQSVMNNICEVDIIVLIQCLYKSTLFLDIYQIIIIKRIYFFKFIL